MNTTHVYSSFLACLNIDGYQKYANGQQQPTVDAKADQNIQRKSQNRDAAILAHANDDRLNQLEVRMFEMEGIGKDR